MNLGNLEFKPADFTGIDMSENSDPRIGSRYGLTNEQAIKIAEETNRLLAERLEKAPKVSGKVDSIGSAWSSWSIRAYFDTHRARLVCIEEITK